MNLPNKQTGLTLLEVIIALALSIILLLGLAQILISNKDTYRYQQSTAFVQENARFAMMFMDDWTQKAGYRATASHKLAEVFPSATAANGCAAFSAEQVVTATSDGTPGFCIRYQAASAGESNCVGNNLAANQVVVTKLFLQNNELRCSAPNSGNVWQTAVLVDGVESFTVRYGLDNNNDRAVDQYLATITADQWDEIYSLRLSAVLIADDETVDGNQTSVTELVGGTSSNPTDQRLRRTSTRTLTLRNLAL